MPKKKPPAWTKKMKHKAAHVLLDGKDYWVDEGVKEILELLWSMGYHTKGSCENTKGCVWLLFSKQEAERFARHWYNRNKDVQPSLKDYLKCLDPMSFFTHRCKWSISYTSRAFGFSDNHSLNIEIKYKERFINILKEMHGRFPYKLLE